MMRKKSVKGPKIQKRNSPASSGVLALSPGGDGDDLLGRDGPRVRPWFWTVCALACSIVDILGTLTWLHVPLDLTTPFLWVLVLAQTLLPLVFVGGILSTNMDDRRDFSSFSVSLSYVGPPVFHSTVCITAASLSVILWNPSLLFTQVAQVLLVTSWYSAYHSLIYIPTMTALGKPKKDAKDPFLEETMREQRSPSPSRHKDRVPEAWPEFTLRKKGGSGSPDRDRGRDRHYPGDDKMMTRDDDEPTHRPRLFAKNPRLNSTRRTSFRYVSNPGSSAGSITNLTRSASTKERRSASSHSSDRTPRHDLPRRSYSDANLSTLERQIDREIRLRARAHAHAHSHAHSRCQSYFVSHGKRDYFLRRSHLLSPDPESPTTTSSDTEESSLDTSFNSHRGQIQKTHVPVAKGYESGYSSGVQLLSFTDIQTSL